MDKISYGRTICLPQVRVLRWCFSPRYSADRLLIISGIFFKYGSSDGLKKSDGAIDFSLRKFSRFFVAKLSKNEFEMPRIAAKRRLFICISLPLKMRPYLQTLDWPLYSNNQIRETAVVLLRVTHRWFVHTEYFSYASFFSQKNDNSCKFDKSENWHDTVNIRKLNLNLVEK
jgi:hypothetical protein